MKKEVSKEELQKELVQVKGKLVSICSEEMKLLAEKVQLENRRDELLCMLYSEMENQCFKNTGEFGTEYLKIFEVDTINSVIKAEHFGEDPEGKLFLSELEIVFLDYSFLGKTDVEISEEEYTEAKKRFAEKLMSAEPALPV